LRGAGERSPRQHTSAPGPGPLPDGAEASVHDNCGLRDTIGRPRLNSSCPKNVRWGLDCDPDTAPRLVWVERRCFEEANYVTATYPQSATGIFAADKRQAAASRLARPATDGTGRRAVLDCGWRCRPRGPPCRPSGAGSAPRLIVGLGRPLPVLGSANRLEATSRRRLGREIGRWREGTGRHRR